MLSLHTGSEIKLLADSLLSELSENPPKNVLAPELFVVQNYGMARWLSLYMAEREGVAANLQFKFPAELFWQTIRLIKPDIPENLPSERHPMTWTLFQILQMDTDSSLTELHEYIQHKDPKKQEMRCWQLAIRIGDVFDQYLTYRPEMILSWQQGTLTTNNSSESWQADLWKKLTDHWQSDEWSHRAVLEQEITRIIDEGRYETNELPSRVSIFGVSEMPNVYTRIILKLSKSTDVHFYLVNSTLNEDNMLVQSWGKAGLEFEQSINDHLEMDNRIEWAKEENKPRQFGGKSLFKTLKNNLLNGKEMAQSVTADNTIQIHSCHSARREVEVLYNQLLDIFDRKHDIKPADVLVLSPQMEAYAPDINAVFGATEQSIPEIPFHLSQNTQVNLVAKSFAKILRLIESRFKVTDVLELIDYAPIRQAFSFSEDDIRTLEIWIDETRIRWGIDEQHKQLLGVPSSKSFTWQAGLHRMLSGYAMTPHDDALFEGIYPYNEIQQSTHAELLGRFSQFIHHLYDCHGYVKNKKTPQQWSALLMDWLDLFYSNDDQVIRQKQSLRNIINGLNDETRIAKFNAKTSFQVIRNYLQERLDEQQTGGGYRGQGVTFSSMIHMRNIPAKVIALIGMNDDAYLRSAKGIGFDLIPKYPRRGDRSQAKIDRQMFLEAVTATGELLYISYTGQSSKKDADFPPSVLVRELTDFIDNNYEINSGQLLQRHRLHGFSTKYYTDVNQSLFSYSKQNLEVSKRLYTSPSTEYSFFDGNLPPPDPAFKTISMNDFISFYQHPAKFMMNQRLGIYLRDDSILDDDRESFEIYSLDKYNLSQEMLKRQLNNQSIASYEKVAKAKNLLPDGWPGEKAFALQSNEVIAFSAYMQDLIDQEQMEPVEVHYKSSGFSVTGRLDTIYEDGQLFYRFGKLRAKDRIEFWIKHLFFQVIKPASHSGESVFISRDNNASIDICRLAPVDRPARIIDTLLVGYWQGLKNRLLFFPKTSYAYAESIIEKDNDEEKAIAHAHKKWDDDWYDYRENIDDYNKLYIGEYNLLEDNDLINKFTEKSISFWSPFFESKNAATERGG